MEGKTDLWRGMLMNDNGLKGKINIETHIDSILQKDAVVITFRDNLSERMTCII
jgi:hypothetical protein